MDLLVHSIIGNSVTEYRTGLIYSFLENRQFQVRLGLYMSDVFDQKVVVLQAAYYLSYCLHWK